MQRLSKTSSSHTASLLLLCRARHFHSTAAKEVPIAVLAEHIIHLAVLQKLDSNIGNGHNIKVKFNDILKLEEFYFHFTRKASIPHISHYTSIDTRSSSDTGRQLLISLQSSNKM